jgi:hypothetical protein
MFARFSHDRDVHLMKMFCFGPADVQAKKGLPVGAGYHRLAVGASCIDSFEFSRHRGKPSMLTKAATSER